MIICYRPSEIFSWNISLNTPVLKNAWNISKLLHEMCSCRPYVNWQWIWLYANCAIKVKYCQHVCMTHHTSSPYTVHTCTPDEKWRMKWRDTPTGNSPQLAKLSNLLVLLPPKQYQTSLNLGGLTPKNSLLRVATI